MGEKHPPLLHFFVLCTQQLAAPEIIQRIIRRFLLCTYFNFINTVQLGRHISPRLHFTSIFCILCTTIRPQEIIRRIIRRILGYTYYGITNFTNEQETNKSRGKLLK
jgi:hypothetical protein